MPSTSTTRCYPPGGAATSVTINSPVNGLVGYAALINAAADAQQVDAECLKALGWQAPAGAGSGTTAQRPPAQVNKGQFYADTTLAAFIWSDGAIWRTFAGAAA